MWNMLQNTQTKKFVKFKLDDLAFVGEAGDIPAVEEPFQGLQPDLVVPDVMLPQPLPRQTPPDCCLDHFRAEAAPGQTALPGQGRHKAMASFACGSNLLTGPGWAEGLADVVAGNYFNFVLMGGQAALQNGSVFVGGLPGAKRRAHPTSQSDHILIEFEDIMGCLSLLSIPPIASRGNPNDQSDADKRNPSPDH